MTTPATPPPRRDVRAMSHDEYVAELRAQLARIRADELRRLDAADLAKIAARHATIAKDAAR